MSVRNLRSLTILTVVFTLLIPTSGSAFEPPASSSEVIVRDRDAKQIAQKKITDRSHPDYKRCRREPIIGSLARMRTVCMTNREWEKFAQRGNAGARSLLDDISKGGLRAE